MESFNFQVNLSGIIDILSKNLYSEERVFIRELLQNAVDAVQAAGNDDPCVEVEWIEPESEEDVPRLIISDNGIGLTEEEIHQFLSNIGASMKRGEIGERPEGLIGRFGIGLLSCFMVADTVTIITKSRKGGPAFKWVGGVDGTYELTALEGEYSVGTQVFITPAPEKQYLLDFQFLKKTLKYYAEFLHIPIFWIYGNSRKRINPKPFPWTQAEEATPEEWQNIMMAFASNRFKGDALLAAFPISSEAGDLQGIGYIEGTNWGRSSNRNLVYLRGMVVSESSIAMVPEYERFVRYVFNANHLEPTASRESLYEDDNLLIAQKDLRKQTEDFLLKTSVGELGLMKQILDLHFREFWHLAKNNNKFFRAIAPMIPVHTTKGYMPVEQYLRESVALFHTASKESFKQLKEMQAMHKTIVINSEGDDMTELLNRLYLIAPDHALEEVSAEQLLGRQETLNDEELEEMGQLMLIARKALAPYHCQPMIKRFYQDKDTLAVYQQNDAKTGLAEAEEVKGNVSGVWSDLIDEMITSEFKEEAQSLLYLNYTNPHIRALAQISDTAVTEHSIMLLYAYALSQSSFLMNQREKRIFGENLLHLVSKK